eukprot:scaffold1614_cov173-Pinguiococcus_pyrenoidosus.AAC.2
MRQAALTSRYPRVTYSLSVSASSRHRHTHVCHTRTRHPHAPPPFVNLVRLGGTPGTPRWYAWYASVVRLGTSLTTHNSPSFVTVRPKDTSCPSIAEPFRKARLAARQAALHHLQRDVVRKPASSESDMLINFDRLLQGRLDFGVWFESVETTLHREVLSAFPNCAPLRPIRPFNSRLLLELGESPLLASRALLASVLPLLFARTLAGRRVRWDLLLGAFVRRRHARKWQTSSACRRRKREMQPSFSLARSQKWNTTRHDDSGSKEVKALEICNLRIKSHQETAKLVEPSKGLLNNDSRRVVLPVLGMPAARNAICKAVAPGNVSAVLGIIAFVCEERLSFERSSMTACVVQQMT